jgi:DNA-binding transcriptional ArsR family regulator
MSVASVKNKDGKTGSKELTCRDLLSSVGDNALSMSEFARLADLYKNFSDPSRLRIIIELASGSLCVQDIADRLGMSQSAISHQLRVLRGARLVRYEKEGKNVVYALDDEHIEDILKIGVEHVRH